MTEPVEQTINYGSVKDTATRTDNRTANQLRPIHCHSSVLTNSAGSVQYRQGATQLYISVQTPVPCSSYRDECNDRCIVQCNIYQPSQSGATSTDIMYSTIVEQVFTHIVDTFVHPRMKLVITVQVIHNDGSLLSCIVNGVMLALLDSGIQLNSLCAATTIVLQHTYTTADHTVQHTNTLLDPVLAEQQSAHTVAVLVYTTSHKSDKLVQLYCSMLGAKIATKQYLDACNIGRVTCQHIIQYIRSLHEKRLQALQT